MGGVEERGRSEVCLRNPTVSFTDVAGKDASVPIRYRATISPRCVSTLSVGNTEIQFFVSTAASCWGFLRSCSIAIQILLIDHAHLPDSVA